MLNLLISISKAYAQTATIHNRLANLNAIKLHLSWQVNKISVEYILVDK